MFKKTARNKLIRVKVPPRKLPPIGEAGRKKAYSGLNKTLPDGPVTYEPDFFMERTKVLTIFMQQTENHRKKFKQQVDIQTKKQKIKEVRLKSV